MDTQKDANDLTALSAVGSGPWVRPPAIDVVGIPAVGTPGVGPRRPTPAEPPARPPRLTVMTGEPTASTYQPDGAFSRGRAVAVTGATGFLGGSLTSMLTDQGARVVVLVHDGVPQSSVGDR